MELKKYDEYSDEEKRELLFHWWHYYGKTVCSLRVMRQFTQMVYDNVDEMFKIGLFSFVNGKNGKDFIDAIICGCVYEYRDMVNNQSSNSENNFNSEDKKDDFIKLLVSSFNSDDQLVISHEEYINGIMSVIDDISIVLTSDKVHDLYQKCLFKDGELENGFPTLPFCVGDGVNSIAIFNFDRLEENKEKISEMIGQLSVDDEGSLFSDLNVNKFGRIWTDNYQKVDMLVQLGNAIGSLECLGSKGEETIFARNDSKEIVPNDTKVIKKIF